jgi:Trk K+ transport system NAD-binding subunit
VKNSLTEPRRRGLGALGRYVLVLLREFRSTLIALAASLVVGGALYAASPGHPDVLTSVYAAWMALFAQPIGPPTIWYLTVLQGIYPLVGFIVIGEGIARFALLMISRRRGEKEWMRVMASTYRDHVVVCGLGHLGYRVLGQLTARQSSVVCVERDEQGKFVSQVRKSGVPIIIRDMKDDQTLLDAGVPHARAIVIATDDDMANMEVAIDARRLNPRIKIVMRLFDQQLAMKLRDAFNLDYAFSSSALAAPAVAAMTLDCKILSAFDLGDVPHVVAEIPVEKGSALIGRAVAELEAEQKARVLAGASGTVREGDVLTVTVEASRVSSLVAAGRAAAA